MSRKLSFKSENKIQTCPGEQEQNYDQGSILNEILISYILNLFCICTHVCVVICVCACVSQHTLEVRG